jgi:hypothetical protein
LLTVGTIFALGLGASALADNTVADGDGVVPIGNNNMAFGNVSCGVATTKTALLAITRQGAVNNNVFNNGAIVTIDVTTVTGAGLMPLRRHRRSRCQATGKTSPTTRSATQLRRPSP